MFRELGSDMQPGERLSCTTFMALCGMSLTDRYISKPRENLSTWTCILNGVGKVQDMDVLKKFFIQPQLCRDFVNSKFEPSG